jgi:hypothetical protein
MPRSELHDTLVSVARTGGILAVLGGCYAALPFRGDRWWLGVAIGVGVLVAIIPVTVHRLRLVLRSDRPGLDAAEALVLLLAMLILGFAAVYFAMNRNAGQFTGLETRIDALYFTVTTLGTVGFGDIAATAQAARLVVTVQILVNLVFIGVAARVFVGAAQHARQRRQDS